MKRFWVEKYHEHYLQIQGTARAQIWFQPIFMTKINRGPAQIRWWRQAHSVETFIGDIFLVWIGTEEDIPKGDQPSWNQRLSLMHSDGVLTLWLEFEVQKRNS